MSKKALLIAGTGTIGVHMIELLNQEGFECWVTSRYKHNDRDRVHYLQGNPHNHVFLKNVLSMYYWTTVVDFTYYSIDELNEVYSILLSHTNLYVFLSSARVYADFDGFIDEDGPRLLDVCKDIDYINSNEYAIVKAKQENYFINGDKKNWIIVRPYITYGENTFQLSPIRKEFWLLRALKGKKIYIAEELLNKETTITYGYDVARSIVALICNKESWGDIYNIMNPKCIKWSDILTIYLNIIESYTGQRPLIYMEERWHPLMTGTYEQIRYDRLYDRRFDCAKLSNFIDISSFMSPKEGIEKCLRTYFNSSHRHEIVDMSHEAQVDKITGDCEALKYLIKYPIKDILKYLYYRLK